MNIFNNAIESHVEWDLQLKKAVENGGLLNVADVANCNTCDLGRWIYGEGIRYNHLPSFETMCTLHEQFHRHAAEVAQHHNAGDHANALSLLTPDGDYAATSARLVRALMDCNNELASSVVKGIRNTTQINDILKHKPVPALHSIDGSASILSALKMMVEHNIGSLAVYDADEFLGIFSERGYVHNVVLKGITSLESAVAELVDPDPIHIGLEDSIELCMRLMTSTHKRHLPVRQDDRVVGIVSIGDVVKQFISDSAQTQSQLESYIYGHYGA